MKTIYFLLVFILLSTLLYSTIINVPADQPKIQDGIDAAVFGDTVLVQPGIYVENIDYNGKNITVASLYITTQDTTYISQTIIDGSQIPYNASVVTFCNGESSNAVLTGFTVSNGSGNFNFMAMCIAGGGIYCDESSPGLENLIISNNSADRGGGIFCSTFSSPSLENVTIFNNSAEFGGGGFLCEFDSSPILVNVTITNNYGGGFSCSSYSFPSLENVKILDNYGVGISCEANSNPSLANVTISGNSGVGIFCNDNSFPNFSVDNRCNIYSNTTVNPRGLGSEISAINCDIIHIIVDTFTVITPTDHYASPIDNFTFDILHCIEDGLMNADVYVSVDGDNSNSGISPDHPFKTITHALEKIYTDSLNVNTIYLASGVYSNSTNGEIFPIHWSNYVNLSGNSEDDTILDAEGTSRVINFNFIKDAVISNITVTNGFTDSYGGGISINNNSSPSLKNIIISGNIANWKGGGIYSFYNSNPSLENITIINNSASYSGGGIYCNNSDPNLKNVTISGNIVGSRGGGIYCYRSDPSLENVTLTGNTAEYGGGIDCTSNSNPILVNCILWNDSPSEICFQEYTDDNSITISYSDIQGGLSGIVTNNNGIVNWLEGNLDEDPLFADPLIGDFHLIENSPCIDAGDPNFPFDLDNTICDMGAFPYFQIKPRINNIVDIPDDQGRQLQIVWERSPLDETYNLNYFYSLWRLDSIFSRDNAILINNLSQLEVVLSSSSKEDIYLQRDGEIWTFIDQIPAMQYLQYAVVAPTIKDSTQSNNNFSTYKVVYHDIDGYYESLPDSGYSVDNIAPDRTEAYITRNGSNMNISWEEVEYGTLHGNSYPEINGIWYKVYAGDTPDFICDEIHLINTVTNLNYDYILTEEEKKFFKVVVSDQP